MSSAGGLPELDGVCPATGFILMHRCYNILVGVRKSRRYSVVVCVVRLCSVLQHELW